MENGYLLTNINVKLTEITARFEAILKLLEKYK